METADGKKLKSLNLGDCEILVQDESAFVSDVSQYNWSLKGKKSIYKGLTIEPLGQRTSLTLSFFGM